MRRQIENDEEKKTVGNYVMGYIDGKYMIIGGGIYGFYRENLAKVGV